MSKRSGDVANAERVRQVLESSKTMADEIALSEGHLEAISRAPEEQWEALATRAVEGHWSSDLTRRVVQTLQDQRISEEERQSILSGETPPYVVMPDGSRRYPAEVVHRTDARAMKTEEERVLDTVLAAQSDLRGFPVSQVVAQIDKSHRDQLIQEIPEYIKFLEELRETALHQ